jgi:hypothetical protein
MTGKRKRYAADFKAKVALEALRGELTTAQLATKHGIHQTMVGEGAAAEGNRLSIDQKFSPIWAAPLRSGASLRLPGATPHLAVLGGQRLHGRYFRWLGVEAS